MPRGSGDGSGEGTGNGGQVGGEGRGWGNHRGSGRGRGRSGKVLWRGETSGIEQVRRIDIVGVQSAIEELCAGGGGRGRRRTRIIEVEEAGRGSRRRGGHVESRRLVSRHSAERHVSSWKRLHRHV